MDLALAALGAMIAMTIILKRRSDTRWRSRKNRRYQRVFTSATLGLLLAGFGLAGGDLRYSHGWFRGVKWSESPIWWQIGLGAALLLLAALRSRAIVRETSR
jgi:hypothetical protein